MKHFKSVLRSGLTLFMAVCLALGAAGCSKKKKQKELPPAVQISVTADKDRIRQGETVQLHVAVENTDDKTYTWTVSDNALAVNENDQAYMTKSILRDRYVTVTATSHADKTAQASVRIRVIAPLINGTVGDLTSAMLRAAGNPNITVTGEVRDYYIEGANLDPSAAEPRHVYDMSVKMNGTVDTSKDNEIVGERWYGVWHDRSNSENVIANMYKRGAATTDKLNATGDALESVYIDKNNNVATKVVKDSDSFNVLWDNRKLWNQIGALGNLVGVSGGFTEDLDSSENAYVYDLDESNEEMRQLMTELAFSLTPMLSDTIMRVVVYVENSAVTKLHLQTEQLLYGSDTNQDPTGMSWTEADLTLSDVGTTVVADPAPYEAPEHADALAAAISHMKAQTGYTFAAKDQTTYRPAGDSEDYASASSLAAGAGRAVTKPANKTAATGTAGVKGWITENAVLLERTTAYDAYDGDPYKLDYTGYRGYSDYYESFLYNATAIKESAPVAAKPGFVATRRYNGTIAALKPAFDFSPNVFTYAGEMNGNYLFRVRDSFITRDLAMQVSLHGNATNGEATVRSSFMIKVRKSDNKLVETSFPYVLTNDTEGLVTTTYADFGNTKLYGLTSEELFADYYVPRTVETNWNQFTGTYFNNHSNASADQETVTGDEMIERMFGNANALPSLDLFVEAFGDNVSLGSFRTNGDPSKDGLRHHCNGKKDEAKCKDCLSITIKVDEIDENGKIANYVQCVTALRDKLRAAGWQQDEQNSTERGDSAAWPQVRVGHRYICFVKGGVQIVVHNQNTGWFYIYFYKAGDWSLNPAQA